MKHLKTFENFEESGYGDHILGFGKTKDNKWLWHGIYYNFGMGDDVVVSEESIRNNLKIGDIVEIVELDKNEARVKNKNDEKCMTFINHIKPIKK